MNKRILSIALVLMMCLSAFSLPALAADDPATVSASYSDGIVNITGTGYTAGTGYVVRVVNTVNSSLTAMTQAESDGSGNLSASVTTGALGTLSNYTVYVNDLAGANVAVDASIEGNAALTYTATITAGTGGSITTGTTGQYVAGAVISLTATANSNYTFSTWTSGNGGTFANASSASTTFTMPANDVTITATFTYSGSSGGGGGGGGGSTPSSGDATVTTVTGTTDSSGKTTASVPANTVNNLVDAVKKAEAKGEEAVVEIEIKTTSATKSAELTIPGTAFAKIADSTDAAVRVDAGIATVTFSADAAENISKKAGTSDISIAVESVDTSTLSAEAQKMIGTRPVYDFTLTAGSKNISDFGGASVSIPYSPKSGEDRNAIVIYYVDDAGSIQTIRGAYNSETGTVDFTAPHFSQYAVGYNKVSFTDVGSGAWYYAPVTFCAARSITTGTSTTTFSPDAAVTRGQFIVMLMRAYGIEPDANPTNNFADAGNTYYTNYLAKAKELGITNGIGNNQFAPESKISRQEMFTMLYRALDELNELPEATTSKALSDFSDSSSISDYAKNAFETLVKGGIVSGSDGKLNPTDQSTRAQMAQILYNLLSA